MMKNMKSLTCAACTKKSKFEVMYSATFKQEDLNPNLYISRRIPDNIHFRIVRCSTCGLVFSNPICEEKKIINLYKQSGVPLMEDLQNSNEVYSASLKKILQKLPSKDNFLDIGCGNGFFLEKVKKLGFKEVWGVEPSTSAVSHLPLKIEKEKIITDIFSKRHFKKNFFDALSFFQVLDHVVNPNKFLEDCFYVLKPGGYVLAIMHNSEAMTHKILGERSPIFDVQHIYLFNKKTVEKIFKNNGFDVEAISNVYTTYTIGYWFKMSPLPNFIKKIVAKMENNSLLQLKISFPAGNMLVIAKKPTV